MANKTLTFVAVISVIAIIFSGIDSYFIFVNPQQTTPVNISNSNLTTIESAQNALSAKVSQLEQQIGTVSQQTNPPSGQTPQSVYTSASKSVVTILTDLGQGSGFMFSEDSVNTTNLIATNWHVVDGASQIEVEFYDRTRSNATVVGTDAYADFAIIRVEKAPADAKPLHLDNSSNLYVGQQLVAIGNPLGLSNSLSSGFVSQLNQQLQVTGLPIIVPVIEIDLTIAPGSSGGPLFDLSANVVGITNAGSNAGFNFAVPSNVIIREAPSLIKQGHFDQPLFGFYAAELNPELINSSNILNVGRTQTGLVVTDVTAGQPAAKAGLTPWVATKDSKGNDAYTVKDIILAVNNVPVVTWTDWAGYISEHVSPGQTVTLTVWRSGTIISLQVTATTRPQYQP